jgi:hypothetical protein
MDPPRSAGARTVVDMPVTEPAEVIGASAREWVDAAWKAWAPHHAQIVRWHAAYAAR